SFVAPDQVESCSMRTDSTDYPVVAPYPTAARTLGAPPPARSLRPVAKAVTLVAICTASLLTGGFVLPGGSRTEAEAVAPAPALGDHLLTGAVAPPAPTVPAAPPAAAEAPQAVAPPRSPHPLDAAPKVVPQLPDGP